MSRAEPTTENYTYWIRQDRAKTLKDAYAKHGPSFPKISRDEGFAALAAVTNTVDRVAWQLYVLALTKILNPGAKACFVDEMDDAKEYQARETCNICKLSFLGDAKDAKDGLAMRRVGGLYKLHKEIYRRHAYDVCAACFYALQNPAVASDYPKSNRHDPHRPDDEFGLTFVQLKRASDLGYHGTFVVSSLGSADWNPHSEALLEEANGTEWLDMTNFSG